MKNPELGRMILKQAEAFPETFDMGDYVSSDNTCGTSACIAGWAMLFSGYELDKDDVFIRPDGSEVGNEFEEGKDLLGLSSDELYYPDSNYDTLFHGATPPQLALARLRSLIEASEDS